MIEVCILTFWKNPDILLTPLTIALFYIGIESMATSEVIIAKIQAALPTATVKAVDLTGGGDHWQVSIRAKEFAGKSLVEQHQLVYKALGDMMKQEIHALALDTKEL